jgi:hypothetical protein
MSIKEILKIFYLEKINFGSVIFTLTSAFYLSTFNKESNDVNVYKIMTTDDILDILAKRIG